MSNKRVLICQIASFALLVAAFSWALIAVAGSDIPIQDQWDSEAGFLYPRWLSGAFTWHDLFRAHNEHRIVFTHLLNLALLWANKQWDPLLQMVAGALIHASGAAVLAWWIARACGQIERIAGIALVFLLNLPLIGWNNALWGFQSQMYFVLLFTFVAFYLVTVKRHLSLGWWLGMISAVCASFSMAAGTFTALSLVAFACFRSLEERRLHRPAAWLGLAGLAVVLIALAFRTNVPEHDVYRARSFIEFEAVFAARLGWPNISSILRFIPLNLPLIGLAVRRLTKKAPESLLGNQALLVGMWGAGTALSEALLRTPGIEFVTLGPPSRYADYLALIPLANGLACMELFRHRTQHSKRWLQIGIVAWCYLFTTGWLELSYVTLRSAVQPRIAEPNASTYATTKYLFKKDGSSYRWWTLVHPDMSTVSRVYAQKEIQSIAPPSLQNRSDVRWPEAPSALVQAHAIEREPTTGCYDAWGTFGPEGADRTGTSKSYPFQVTSSAVQLSVYVTKSQQITMQFVSLSDGARFPVDLNQVQDHTWQNVLLRLHPGQFQLEVQSTSGEEGVGFTQPRAVGFWSYQTRRLLENSGEILWAAGGLFLLTLFGLKSDERAATLMKS